ncbi:hypothetical protein ACE10Z_01905 [Bradyrhizobium sp. Pha-3]
MNPESGVGFARLRQMIRILSLIVALSELPTAISTKTAMMDGAT